MARTWEAEIPKKAFVEFFLILFDRIRYECVPTKFED
jgi:hypothetical protein